MRYLKFNISLTGFCGFSWCLVCYLFVYETPKEHPTITAKELEFISKNMGPTEQKQVSMISLQKFSLFFVLITLECENFFNDFRNFKLFYAHEKYI